jgi:hypothetical protein
MGLKAALVEAVVEVSTTADPTAATVNSAKVADNHLPTDRTDLLQLVAATVVLILVAVAGAANTVDLADLEWLLLNINLCKKYL